MVASFFVCFFLPPSVSYKKTFNDIGNAAEFWQWVEGPFYQGLYPSTWCVAALTRAPRVLRDAGVRQSVASTPAVLMCPTAGWRASFRYNGRKYDTTQQGYVLDTFRLVGGIRMRQSRMANTSCVERRFLAETAVHDGAAR